MKKDQPPALPGPNLGPYSTANNSNTVNGKKRDRDAYGTFETDIIVPPAAKKAKVTADPDASDLSPPPSPFRLPLAYELASFKYQKYGEYEYRQARHADTPLQRKPTFAATVRCHPDNDCDGEHFGVCPCHQINCEGKLFDKVPPTMTGKFDRASKPCTTYDVPFFTSFEDCMRRLFQLGSRYLRVQAETHTLYHAEVMLGDNYRGISIELGFFETKSRGVQWHYDYEEDKVNSLICKLNFMTRDEWHEIVTGPLPPVV